MRVRPADADGLDSDHPRAEGEVGKVGVAIDSIADMRVLLAEHPARPGDDVDDDQLDGVDPAAALRARRRGAGCRAGDQISGTIQNDLLKEYIARGTYVYPPRPSMRIITDIFEYCAKNIPKWNTISISGYHIREAGSTAVQEIAFTLANAIAYVQAAIDAGLDVDDFGPRLSFFWNGHNNFFEEVAKFRASRRMWHRIMTERFGAKDPRSAMLRFHTQTGGSTLTAQQPLNNVVRVSLQALAAVLGGTQSLHTNGYDEALSLPTEEAARLALRTQQIIADESGVVDTPDPLAGSYFVESLTDDVERLGVGVHRPHRRDGRGRGGDRGALPDGRDRAGRVRVRQVDRRRRARDRRAQQVHARRRAGAEGVLERSGARARSARTTRRVQGRSRHVADRAPCSTTSSPPRVARRT